VGAATQPQTPSHVPSATKPDDGVSFRDHRPGRPRISAGWVGVIAGELVLVLLGAFILQNTRSIKISYFGATGTLSLGVALLFAAIGGLLLAGVVVSLRIWQLRQRSLGRGIPPQLPMPRTLHPYVPAIKAAPKPQL
jgi:uncharacterized integral membrane protein